MLGHHQRPQKPEGLSEMGALLLLRIQQFEWIFCTFVSVVTEFCCMRSFQVTEASAGQRGADGSCRTPLVFHSLNVTPDHTLATHRTANSMTTSLDEMMLHQSPGYQPAKNHEGKSSHHLSGRTRSTGSTSSGRETRCKSGETALPVHTISWTIDYDVKNLMKTFFKSISSLCSIRGRVWPSGVTLYPEQSISRP